jgi:hypothetical protein
VGQTRRESERIEIEDIDILRLTIDVKSLIRHTHVQSTI